MRNSKSLTNHLSFLHRMPKLLLSVGIGPILSLSLCLSLSLSLSLSSCDKKSEGTPQCETVTLNKPFIAKIGQTFCLPEDHWKITFGPFIEDSRCNVPEIECVWAGRFVMSALIEANETTRDTFYAVRDWRDTIQGGPYTVILNKVLPEIRESMEPLDTSAYSFEIIIK